MVKYVAMSLLLSSVDNFINPDFKAGIFYIGMSAAYLLASVSLIGNHIWAMKKFKEAITVISVKIFF